MTMKTKSIALFLIASCAQIHWANAQIDTKKEPKTACFSAKSIKAPQLYGIWQVTFTNPPAGLPKTAVMLLEKHKEFSDSLSGIVSRDGVTASGHTAKAALAGDVEDGFVILDESSNNISMERHQQQRTARRARGALHHGQTTGLVASETTLPVGF
jgi:hypothetical protein